MRHTWAQIIPYFRPRLPTTSTLPPSESPERNQEGSGNTHLSGNPLADASKPKHDHSSKPPTTTLCCQYTPAEVQTGVEESDSLGMWVETMVEMP